MSITPWSESPAALLAASDGIELDSIDPGATPGFDGGKKAAEALLAAQADQLADLQERLWADAVAGGRRSVLLIVQGMDTAGKGGAVRHSFRGLNPQGLRAFAFGVPTAEEREHDFLWRVRKRLPGPGIIGVFDRSHYEDVLIHRVRGLSSPAEVEERYGAIVAFEREIVASGTLVVKVMLHISADEQRKRLAARLDRPEKHWKFSPSDIDERGYWAQYQEAYEIAMRRTVTADAPWFVVPANKKYFARIAVQRLMIDALESLELGWPTADFDVEAEKLRLASS